MNTDMLERLRSEAQSLDPSERAQLALDLLQSLDAGVSASDIDVAWNTEALRRLDRFDRDDGPTVDAQDMHARALSRLR